MKKIVATAALAFFAVAASAWVLAWNGPTNQPVMSFYSPGSNQCYKLYGAALGTASNSAPLIAVFTNWNILVTNGLTYYSQTVLTNNPPNFFFLMTSSNNFGESLPGNIALTGPPTEPAFITLLTTH